MSVAHSSAGERPVSDGVHRTVAVDLGGTHVRAAMVDEAGNILRRIRRSTPTDDPSPAFLVDLMHEIRADDACERAVIGLPGVIDHESEVLYQAPNLPQRWIPMLTDAWLSERSGLSISLANDADLAAVGEAAFGACRGFRDVVYVTISTGIGAGIVLGDHLMRGRYSGGEVGHTILSRTALAAGEPATVEDLGSGTSITRRARAAGLDYSGAELADRVRSGEPAATEIWAKAIESAAAGIVNLCWIVTPQAVVIGGGVGMNGDIVLPVVAQAIEEHGPGVCKVAVLNAGLGDDAALAGAAAWWHAIGREG